MPSKILIRRPQCQSVRSPAEQNTACFGHTSYTMLGHLLWVLTIKFVRSPAELNTDHLGHTSCTRLGHLLRCLATKSARSPTELNTVCLGHTSNTRLGHLLRFLTTKSVRSPAELSMFRSYIIHKARTSTLGSYNHLCLVLLMTTFGKKKV